MSRKVPAGWYPYDGEQRYWDGERWTENWAPAPRQEESPIVAVLVGIAGLMILLVVIGWLGIRP